MAFGTTPLSTTTLGANQFPVSAVAIPGHSGGNLTALRGANASTDSNGNELADASMAVPDGNDITQGITTDAAVTGDTAGTISAKLRGINKLLAGTLTVAGTVTVNAGTNLNTSALALDTSVNGVLLAQASTTSGQKGPLMQGAVTTSAPSYTTAQTSPISLTTAGAIRVDASATTQPVSGTVTANIGTTNGLALDATVGKLNVAQATALGSNTGPMMQGSVTSAAPSYTTGNINPLSLTTAGALRVDGSGVTQPVSGTFWQATQPVSGTVTANIGTTNGLALDTSVNGIIVAQGSTTSGEKGPLMQGAVTTSAPSYTTAQTSPISLTTAGAVRVDGSAVTQPVSGTFWQATQPVSGTITANAGTGPFPVAGMVASGASNANNPVKTGGVFNTTQPTVTNGQVVDAQYTARGAAIVSTGVDTFNVTVNAALPTGANTIGAVTQASGPWTSNITQFGSNPVATGTGAGGVGIPRVTVSNDSQIQVWDGTRGPVTVKAANISPLAADLAMVQALSPNNTGLPVNLPVIVQKTSNVSSGSVASLAKAFTSNNVQGNSIVVVCAVGNNTAPTISDTNSNTYTQALTPIANGTAFEVAIFYAVGIASGANTVTVNNGGTTASIAMEIYEVSGLIAQVQAQPDQTATNTGSSGTASTGTISALSPNEYAFAGVGIGTAAQTITAGAGWTNDSGQQNPTTPAGLFSFVSLSQFLGSLKAVTPQATFTSEPWAIAVATFRPVILGIEGTAKLTDGTVTMAFGQNTMANSLPVAIASNQSNVPTNVAQFGGTNVVTGTGAGGAGIPRVTVSNDSTIGSNSATGSTVPANAFYLAGDAATALPTAATAGNLTGAMVDKFGRQVVVPETVRDLKSNIPGLTLTSTTETTLIAAVAATFNDITSIIVENTSATAVRVDFRDSTGGTIQFSLYLVAGDTRGFSQQFYKQTTVNTNWTAQLSAAVTDVRIYGNYVANK